MRTSGFTLIELAIVIVILLIGSVVVFLSISSYRSINLRTAAEKVSNDLRYAKNLSLSSTKWHGVAFQLSPVNTYNLYETDGTTDTDIKTPEKSEQDFVINLNRDYGGVFVTNVNIDGNSKIEFSPEGIPYTDKLGVKISSIGIITLATDNSSVTVRIDPETGRVYIQ